MIKRVSLFKFFILCLILILTFGGAEAKTHKVVGIAQDEISLKTRLDSIILVLIPAQDVGGSDKVVAKDTFIKIRVNEIIPAKRGKRSAKLEGELVSYSLDKNFYEAVKGGTVLVKIKNYSKADFKNIGISAATSVAGYALGIPFFSQGVAAIKGAVNPIEDKNRLQSAGISIYKSTPLTYVEKGADLSIKNGDLLTVSLKRLDDDVPEMSGIAEEVETNDVLRRFETISTP